MLMLRHLCSLLCVTLALTASAQTPAPRNVQKATDGTNAITESLAFGSSKTGSFLAGSTLTVSGAFNATPTGGTLNLAATTLTLPATVSGGGSTFQPLNSGLTAIAALTTTSYGRSTLSLADAAAGRTYFGVVIGTNVQSYSANLDAFALKTAPNGTVVGTTDTQTLTGKTISGSSNTLTNIPLGTAVTGTALGANGGTGVANTGKTITLGGNLTTSGAFTTTLVSTANTTVTLPTSGTLGTLDLGLNNRVLAAVEAAQMDNPILRPVLTSGDIDMPALVTNGTGTASQRLPIVKASSFAGTIPSQNQWLWNQSTGAYYDSGVSSIYVTGNTGSFSTYLTAGHVLDKFTGVEDTTWYKAFGGWPTVLNQFVTINTLYVSSATVPSGGNSYDATHMQYSFGIEFFTDSALFAVSLRPAGGGSGSSVRVLVNGRYVGPYSSDSWVAGTTAPTSFAFPQFTTIPFVTGSWPASVVLDFTGSPYPRRPRHIRIETGAGGSLSTGFYGVTTGLYDAVWAPAKTKPRLLVVGDSLSTETGAGTSLNGSVANGNHLGYAYQTAKMLGMDAVVDGYPGTGFFASGGFTGYTGPYGIGWNYPNRVAANVIPYINGSIPTQQVDAILLSVSQNDGANNGVNYATQVAPNFTAWWTLVRAANPTIPIIVMGVAKPTNLPTGAMQTLETAAYNTWLSFNDTHSIFVPMAKYFTGTSAYANPTADGNTYWYNYDSAHPNAPGHWFDARVTADAVRSALSR